VFTYSSYTIRLSGYFYHHLFKDPNIFRIYF